jgi:hypothetical protein
MKKVAILFVVLLTSSFVFAQNTYVPDDKFEQALIDLGYDTTLDDSVLTANISGVTTLDVSSKEISDLTGIEAFTVLIDLSCAVNQLTSLDVSNNTALEVLNLDDNQLTSLDVSKNTALTTLDCNSNQLTTLDVSNNTALRNLTCADNQLTSLDVTKNTGLRWLYCHDNKLTSLDMSRNTELFGLFCVNNSLTSLNMRNGVTDSLKLFQIETNPSLTCIETLDPAYATANWTSANGNIDAGVTFAYICGVDVDGVSTYNNNGIKAITFNVELPTHSLPDTDISLGFWKSGAENHECTGCNGRDTVSMRKLSDDHWEATVGLDTTLVAGDTGESQYWYHYFKTIPDYKIKEDLERFKLETNPDGLRGLMNGWHKVSPLVNKDTVVAWQNIAPVSFDWVSSALDTINISKTNLTDTYELKWSESKDVDIDTIEYLISVSVGQLPADMIHETADTSMTIYYQDIIDTWYPNFAMLSRGTLKFSVSATDGLDTVKVSGDDRVLFVNRYEFLFTEGEGVPVEFALHENYPNPFNPTTALRFDLPEVSDVTLTIYNMLGQKVRTFDYQNTSAGYHSVKWNATNDLGEQVGAGVYLYQLQTKDFVKTRKMVLLK